MSEIHNDPSLSLYFNLPPPGQIGQGFDNLAVDIHGVPIGESKAGKTLASFLGYSDKDTIGTSLKQIFEDAAKLNITLLISGSADQTVKDYLDNLDPGAPNVPPIKALILISDNDLKKGKIGGVDLQKKHEASENINDAANIQGSFDLNIDKESEHLEKTETKVEKHDLDLDFDLKTKKGGKKSGKSSKDFDASLDASFKKKDIDVDLDVKGKVKKDDSDEDLPYFTLGGYQKKMEREFEHQEGISKGIQDGIDIASQINKADAQQAQNVTISVGGAGGSKGPGNLWLSGNAYVTFLVVFAQLQRILMQNKVVQSKIDLAGMEMVVELAKTTAKMIMDIAHMNQLIHIVTAVMSAVSICIAGLGLAGGVMNYKSSPIALEIGTTVGQIGASVEKMSTGAVQASQDLGIAEKEGMKEMLQAYRTIAQRQMEKASDAFKTQEDQIQQLIQALDKIRDGLDQAIAAGLRR